MQKPLQIKIIYESTDRSSLETETNKFLKENHRQIDVKEITNITHPDGIVGIVILYQPKCRVAL